MWTLSGTLRLLSHTCAFHVSFFIGSCHQVASERIKGWIPITGMLLSTVTPQQRLPLDSRT
jgi:hypothetical protein